jgi:hypothetical protein
VKASNNLPRLTAFRLTIFEKQKLANISNTHCYPYFGTVTRATRSGERK